MLTTPKPDKSLQGKGRRSERPLLLDSWLRMTDALWSATIPYPGQTHVISHLKAGLKRGTSA